MSAEKLREPREERRRFGSATGRIESEKPRRKRGCRKTNAPRTTHRREWLTSRAVTSSASRADTRGCLGGVGRFRPTETRVNGSHVAKQTDGNVYSRWALLSRRASSDVRDKFARVGDTPACCAFRNGETGSPSRVFKRCYEFFRTLPPLVCTLPR